MPQSTYPSPSRCKGCGAVGGQRHKAGCPIAQGQFHVKTNEPQFASPTVKELYAIAKARHVDFLIIGFIERHKIINIIIKPAVQESRVRFRIWGNN